MCARKHCVDEVLFIQGPFYKIQGKMGKIQGLFKDLSRFFNFQGLFKGLMLFQGLFKARANHVDVHLEKFSLNFSSILLVIRVNLLHPQPSLFPYNLLLSLLCFSI